MATTQSISPRFSPQTIRRRSRPVCDCVRRIDSADLAALLAAEARIARLPKSSVRRAKKAVQR